MKRLLFLLLVPAVAFSQKASNKSNAKVSSKPAINIQKTIPVPAAKEFVIAGNIAGLTDGEVKVTTTQGEQVIASGAAKGGEFVLKGSVKEPGLYWITL